MTDEISEACQRAAGRPPRDGGLPHRTPAADARPDTGTTREITRRWTCQASRWEGFITPEPAGLTHPAASSKRSAVGRQCHAVSLDPHPGRAGDRAEPRGNASSQPSRKELAQCRIR